jgi:demethylmenaquinone methyltransferase/2-methoxy-6-polyprenyl-1,4-benzoquinol methylase
LTAQVTFGICQLTVLSERWEATMVQYYAQRASEYERIYHKPERQADLLAISAFVGSASRVAMFLKWHAARGYWTQLLSERATSVMATDIN